MKIELDKITTKKVLFLCMTCNDPLYVEQNKCIMETWGKKIIDKVYGENVQIMFYDGWDKQHTYDPHGKILHIRCEDDLDGTYKKTYYALNVIQKNYDFDYIFRTNTSTYINVPLALKLIDYIDKNNQEDIIWTPEVLSLVEACCPFPLDLYARGNGMILSRKTIQRFLDYGLVHLYSEHVDDVMMCNVINSYWLREGKDYLDYIKGFPHGWYRCVEEDNFTNNHRLCEYYNRNNSWDFLKQFVTIQVKQYYHREDEMANCRELHSFIGNKIDENLDETFNKLLEYSENPSVFLGSVIGYINYDVWLRLDKRKLWDIECKNKADNDPHKEKFLNKVWY